MNVSSSRISSRNYWGNRSSDKGDLPDKTSLKSGYLGVRQRDSYTPSNQVADSNPYKIALNKHRYAQKSLNTGKTGDQALPDTLSNALKTELRTLVEDKTSFDRTLKTVFGPSYDSQRADQIAEMIRNDDFSWMPKIAMLPPNAMGEGKGAYDSKNNVVYLNSAISGRTEAATQVLMEEVGHFLDATLNKTDTVGDEGEHFRRIVSGETLSVADLRSIRADNDKGVIVVNGKKVEVEFFWGALKKAGKAIGGGFKKAGKAVGRGFKRAGKAIGRGFKRTGKAVGRGFKRAGKAIGNGFNAVGKSVVVGFKSVVGIGKKVFSGLKQAAFSGIRQMRKVVNTGLRWGGRVLSGIGQGIKNIPVIGDFLATVSKPAVAFGKRLASAGRGLLNGAISVAEGVARGAADTLSELGSGLSDLLKGDFKASWNHLKNAGISYIRLPWDGLLMTAATVISAVQTTTFLEPVGRRLRGKEIDMLKKVFGNSIDYSAVTIKEGPAGIASVFTDRAFVAGNTIYLQKKLQEPGKINALLVHEMTHVWQHQHGGTDYMIDALAAQQSSLGYDWEASVPKTRWADLNPEQQAQLLEDAQGDDFFSERTKFVVEGVDYTAYLNNALRQVRLGVGAP